MTVTLSFEGRDDVVDLTDALYFEGVPVSNLGELSELRHASAALT